MGGDVPSNTTSRTVTELPAYIQPYAVNLMTKASGLSNRAYTPYKGQQVTPLNTQHNQGMFLANNRALKGSPMLAGANNQANRTLTGGYLGQGAYQNPLANMNTAARNSMANTSSATRNAMADTSSATRNAMAGVDNPYLNQVISNTNQDIVNTFRNAQMPQTDASFARSGAFGGSAWQQANAENNRQMASEIAKNTANLRMGDYTQQQGLAENLANRQQQDIQSRQGLAENYAARQQQDIQGRQNLAENFANRQSQSMQNQQNYAQQYANQQQNAFQNERQRQAGMVAQGQGLHNQAYSDAQQLLNTGDIQRDYNQTLANTNYQNFLNQQNYPLQNLDVLGNAISRLMGGGGSSVSTNPMPQVNRTAGAIGGGMAGYAGGQMLGNALGGAASQYGGAAGAGLGALAGLFG